MKGRIYPTWKRDWAGKLVLDEDGNKIPSGYNVRFGRKICRHFTEKVAAERLLTGLRFKTDEGSFDERDYSASNPLGFKNQAKKWLKHKKMIIGSKHYANLKRYMQAAIKQWDNINIKLIGEAEIEDFLFDRKDISDKTRAMMKSCLHDFWKWVVRREKRKSKIEMPEFPTCPYELQWRDIVDLDTQQAIINRVKELSFHINPKIYLGIKLCAAYPKLRPGTLLKAKEKHFDMKLRCLIIPHPKQKNKPQLIWLEDDDIELIESIPRGLPELHYFRHIKGVKGCRAGQRFGEKYLYKWWVRACDELGVKVDLYGGTRHSTVTAMGDYFSKEDLKSASGNTSKAFERYFQAERSKAKKVTAKYKEVTSNQQLINDSKVVDFKQHTENIDK